MPSKLALLFVLLASGAPAQTVDELIARNVEARGGLASLVAIETLRIAIEEERDAPGQTFVFYTKKIEVNVPMDDAIFRMPS